MTLKLTYQTPPLLVFSSFPPCPNLSTPSLPFPRPHLLVPLSLLAKGNLAALGEGGKGIKRFEEKHRHPHTMLFLDPPSPFPPVPPTPRDSPFSHFCEERGREDSQGLRRRAVKSPSLPGKSPSCRLPASPTVHTTLLK
ncbi:hypothetical protein CVT25_012142, partial [Psilocybe cyanescens]